jgi:hypothetical protein
MTLKYYIPFIVYVSIVLYKRSIIYHGKIRNPASYMEIMDSIHFTLFSRVMPGKYWDSSYKKKRIFPTLSIQSRPLIRRYKSDTTGEASLNKVTTKNEQWKPREIYAAV